MHLDATEDDLCGVASHDLARLPRLLAGLFGRGDDSAPGSADPAAPLAGRRRG